MRYVVAGVIVWIGAMSSPPWSVVSRSGHIRSEIHRLRTHFDSVEAAIAGHPAAGLTPAQRSARAELLTWLREYRDAGRFPLNDLDPDKATPIFRDRRGVLCAMAYLIDRSGRSDIVNRVARWQNTVYIDELAGDRDLRNWLDSTGLSLAEAARIQPTYGPPSPQPVSTDYAIASVLASGTALTTVALNLVKPTEVRGVAGLLAGTVALAAGIPSLDGNRNTRKVAWVNTIAGSLGVIFGLRGIIEPEQPSHSPAVDQEFDPGRIEVTIMPWVIQDLPVPGLGVMVRARF